ncbi:discoidin domain-containing protein [Desulfovibrio sp. JC010]|uniref:NADase-type glycan-binding domain-containing protein n=1 Tax=Desulfovibrio sp. JC010 TaxID=2593641 RepID=UPI0013D2AC7B|nr:discoidin domain-containing protein [Desulfovibrio sp. JC010]NDV28636.1 discoidin domain-containing protein [Desulfovibrio sp. JC010]
MLRKFIFLICFMALPSIAVAQPFHVRASSFVPMENETVFDSRYLTDSNSSTGWIENSEGSGSGEWVQFFFPAQVIVDSVQIVNGVDGGPDIDEVGRIKDVSVAFSGGQRQEFTLMDSAQKQSPRIRKFPTTSLGFNVRSVYKQKSVEHAGFAEVVIKYHRITPEEIKAAAVPKNGKLDTAVAGEAVVVKPRKMSAEEKKVLYDKMSKLEKKQVVLDEMKVFFDKFYTYFVTINEEYPRMYTQDNFLLESSTFENFRAMLEKRKVLDKYQSAVVSTSGLRFSIRTQTPTQVELWVKGEYTVIYDMKSHQVTENALFHLKKEYGEWKVKNKTEF